MDFGNRHRMKLYSLLYFVTLILIFNIEHFMIKHMIKHFKHDQNMIKHDQTRSNILL